MRLELFTNTESAQKKPFRPKNSFLMVMLPILFKPPPPYSVNFTSCQNINKAGNPKNAYPPPHCNPLTLSLNQIIYKKSIFLFSDTAPWSPITADNSNVYNF